MMALRFILVGLVASMGFELPSVQDLESWTRNGRNWVDARLADVSNLRLELSRACSGASDCERDEQPAPAPAVEAASTRTDLSFEVVVDGLAKDFTADLAMIEKAKPAEAAVAAVEPSREMPEAVPSPSPWETEVPAAEIVAEVRSERVEEPAPVVALIPTPAAISSREEKISTAVRLTRETLSAWAAVIQPSVGENSGDNQDDCF